MEDLAIGPGVPSPASLDLRVAVPVAVVTLPREEEALGVYCSSSDRLDRGQEAARQVSLEESS